MANNDSEVSEEEADPAEELDESVRIVSGWVIILHPTGNHHLKKRDDFFSFDQIISYQLNEQHQDLDVDHLGRKEPGDR